MTDRVTSMPEPAPLPDSPPISQPPFSAPLLCGTPVPGIVTNGIEVRSQAELEALRGCTAVFGDLSIFPFDDADLTPLASLQSVGGTFTVGDLYEDPPRLAFPSLRGLESLREVGGLSLRGVIAPTLANLQGLAQVTRSPQTYSQFVYIDQCPMLTDLHGLENLAGMSGFVAKGNPRLTSVAGLRVPADLDQFEIWDSPVSDLGALQALTAVQTLWLSNTGLTHVSGLEQLANVNQLHLSGNAALVDLTGLQALRSVSYILIIENRSLERLPTLDQLSELQVLSVYDNPALSEALPWPALRGVSSVEFRRNAALSRLLTLSALETADEIHVDANPDLVQLDLGRLERVGYLRVTHNPLLDSELVPRPTGTDATIGGNLGEALGLDPCPWSGNSRCEGPPLDDLCALGADSDCR